MQSMVHPHRGCVQFQDSLSQACVTWDPKREQLKTQVGPMILRTAEKDDEVAVDGRTMVIKAGSHLLLNVRDYHVDPDYFPDPHDIRLDRYKGAREACFMAFGHGPKSCVGQHFAMVEMKAILTEVLRHLEFSTPQDLASMQTRWDIANHPVDPATFFVRQKPADC
ncbi:unnamed protein product [Effrenium voratum]|nr:unnamed protein product [Effrenium voratum]